MLLPAACLFLRRYKSRTDDKQPISVSVDSVYLDTLQIVIAHTVISRVTTPERLTTPLEYELWFLSKTLISLDGTNPLAVVPSHLIQRSRQEFLRISRMDVSE